MPINCVTDHHVVLMDRGGRTPINDLWKPQKVSWNRVRDDISDASVTITGESCRRNADVLDAIRTGRYELAIWRGTDRVWEGPCTLLQYGRNSATITARDVMHYAARTAMHAKYDNTFPNTTTVVARAARILRTELARKEALSPPINVVPYITEYHFANEARTAALTREYANYVWNHVDDLAANSGMDYTVLGRKIMLWDTSNPIGYTSRVTQADFLGDIEVTEYGLDLATRSIVTNGQGVYGVYPSVSNVDPYYGEWEFLSNPYDETDTGAQPTSNEMASQARRNLSGRNPAPVVLNVPDGSRLNPRGTLSISDLVPGVYIPVEANLTARTLVQTQKLDQVHVSEDSDGEQITVSMSPSTKADAA